MVQKILIDFPAIRDLWISAYQDVDTWILPATGQVELEIKYFDINAIFDLHINDDGFLHPWFHEINIEFGDTNFSFDNWFTEFLAWQAI